MDGKILELQEDLSNGLLAALMNTIELAARERRFIHAEEPPRGAVWHQRSPATQEMISRRSPKSTDRA
jgi:hypothetical protein